MLKKRAACVAMAVTVLICSLLSPLTVRAEDSWTDILVQGYATAKYVIASVFGLVSEDQHTYLENQQEYKDFMDQFVIDLEAEYRAGKDVTMSSEDLQKLYVIVKESLSAQDGYYILTPNMTFDDAINRFCVWDSSYERYREHYKKVFLEYSGANEIYIGVNLPEMSAAFSGQNPFLYRNISDGTYMFVGSNGYLLSSSGTSDKPPGSSDRDGYLKYFSNTYSYLIDYRTNDSRCWATFNDLDFTYLYGQKPFKIF